MRVDLINAGSVRYKDTIVRDNLLGSVILEDVGVIEILDFIYALEGVGV